MSNWSCLDYIFSEKFYDEGKDSWIAELIKEGSEIDLSYKADREWLKELDRRIAGRKKDWCRESPITSWRVAEAEWEQKHYHSTRREEWEKMPPRPERVDYPPEYYEWLATCELYLQVQLGEAMAKEAEEAYEAARWAVVPVVVEPPAPAPASELSLEPVKKETFAGFGALPALQKKPEASPAAKQAKKPVAVEQPVAPPAPPVEQPVPKQGRKKCLPLKKGTFSGFEALEVLRKK